MMNCWFQPSSVDWCVMTGGDYIYSGRAAAGGFYGATITCACHRLSAGSAPVMAAREGGGRIGGVEV